MADQLVTGINWLEPLIPQFQAAIAQAWPVVTPRVTFTRPGA